jgi:hypothetical protein
VVSGVLKYLFGTNTGRAILVGLIFLGAMATARWYYVDRPRALEAEARGAGAALLESMAEKLDDAVSEAAETELFVASLPKLTEWYPADLPCDARLPFPAERDPVWDVLGAPKDGTTAFQYRFERTDNTFKLRARRDADCDNLYTVHTLTGSTDWTSMMSTEMETQNLGE